MTDAMPDFLQQHRGIYSSIAPRTALHETKSPATQLGLLDEGVSNKTILDAMIKQNCQIVCTRKGARLCRPSEMVPDLLDRFPPGPFQKEDGRLLIDHEGRRVG